ncbi:hypothetical protein COV56_01040 [Candidatus Kuenenbacteria bacterium CG11_big_fil_rev_8_21_14_0_20_37_9]|nr:MAG: hypothetical protein COV56_01040 [Candidatus Kuenenbacteria bacterium CG11_big_fil_rev_8_21_14_0_20_37_9]
MAGIILAYLFLAFIPLIAYFFIRREFVDLLQNAIALIFLNLLVFTFYLFWWLMFYHSFLDYFLDIWIVTNRRIINIEQLGLFHRVVAENKLFRIQDVVAQQKGILSTFLNYGEVHIQTAGAEKVIIFEQIARPNYIAQEIIGLVEKHKRLMTKETG